ncbi:MULTISPECIES: hypothetical protein [Gluconobacter]|nr:hypothetical protein [Gluconobacter cerevisiae]
MKTLLLVSMAVMALSLTACGKKGAPHAPGPAKDITYPGVYPPE